MVRRLLRRPLGRLAAPGAAWLSPPVPRGASSDLGQPAGAWTRRTRHWWTLVIGAELIVLYAPTVQWLWERWTLSVWHNAHGMAIPAIVGYFVWIELRRFPRPDASEGHAAGFAFLLTGLLVHAVDTGLHTELLSAASIVVVLPGLALLLLGKARTRAIAFPLVFLAFMLPIPLDLTEHVHLMLRRITTLGTAAAVPWVGIPVFAEATTLHIANASLQVADACSGFSTLYAACAVACLTAYTTCGWRRLAVLLCAVPLAISANVVRVAMLVVLVYWQGSDVLATSLHTISGLITFALVLPMLFWIGRMPDRSMEAA